MSEDLITSDSITQRSALRASSPDAHDVLLTWLNQPEHELADAVRDLSPEQITRLLSGIGEVFRRQVTKFTGMQEIGSALGQTMHLDELLQLIMDKIVRLMDAERATLFLVDPDTGELWSKVAQGDINTEIRLQPGEGLAGWVAQTGTSINVRDAYNDERFQRGVDLQTGFDTRNMLCQPVRNQEGEIIGVVQVLNRAEGSFSDQDESLLSAIASQTAVAIENSKLYLSVLEQNTKLERARMELQHKVRELDLLYDVERELSAAVDLEELVESITQKTLELISAQASALTLHEAEHNRMFVMVNRAGAKTCDGGDASNGRATATGEPQWEFSTRDIPHGYGIASKVIASKTTFRCDTGGCGEVADAASDEIGICVESVICVPLFDEDECIGALEVMNRVPSPNDSMAPFIDQPLGFSEDDRKVLTLIAGQIASTVAARRHRYKQEKVERLSAIGQMLTGVVHDLKNPIAVISGNAQLMVRADDREKRSEYAASINKQFEHLNQMTRELLSFARGEHEITMAEVDLEAFNAEVDELLLHELNDTGVTYETKLIRKNDAPKTAKFDAGKIKRAIMNLARNAAEAMPDGGHFEMRVERDENPAEIRFVCSDTGPGVPEDIQATLFDSFVTSGKQNGTGLGLAIVKKIVDDHHASITYQNQADGGAAFIIRIPQLASI